MKQSAIFAFFITESLNPTSSSSKELLDECMQNRVVLDEDEVRKGAAGAINDNRSRVRQFDESLGQDKKTKDLKEVQQQQL